MVIGDMCILASVCGFSYRLSEQVELLVTEIIIYRQPKEKKKREYRRKLKKDLPVFCFFFSYDRLSL